VGGAIGDILTPAIGVAISPVPIIAVILMLFSRHAARNSFLFLVAWVLGLAAVGTIVLVFGSASSSSGGGESTAAGIVKLAIGALFLLLAAHAWRGRPKQGEKAKAPEWMSAIDEFTALKSFGVGILLSAINPKNLGLTITAGASIAAAGLSSGEEVGVFAIFLLIASLTIALPVIYYALAREQAQKRLDSLKEWLIEHNAAVMTTLLVVIGVKLIGDGIGILS
jgi:threonine/homoserine/homoserine lactone efflux protein